MTEIRWRLDGPDFTPAIYVFTLYFSFMSGLLDSTKNLWRKSMKLKESPYKEQNVPLECEPTDPTRPGPDRFVTLAVVGCGQRGKAS